MTVYPRLSAQRIVAFVLLASHLLCSCSNPAIEVSKKQALPSAAQDHQEKLQDFFSSSTREEKLTIDSARLIPLEVNLSTNNKEETYTLQASNLALTKDASINIKTAKARSIFTTNSNINKSFSREHTSHNNKETIRKKKKGAKKTNSLVTFKIPKISPKENSFRIPSRTKITTTGRHYKPAKVQPGPATRNLMDHTCMPALATREGHRVYCFLEEGYWRALVEENCAPGFSREWELPIYYPTSSLSNSSSYSIEHLTRVSQALQRQLLHVILPKLGLPEGMVYTGPKMGLLAGGWFGFIASSIVNIAVAMVVGGFAGGPAGAIVGGLVALAGCITKCVQRLKASKKLENISKKVAANCDKVLYKARQELKKVELNKDSYKKIKIIASNMEDNKEKIDAGIDKLKGWDSAYEQEDWFFMVNTNIDLTSCSSRDKAIKQIPTSNFVKKLFPSDIAWDKDKAYCQEHIRENAGKKEEIDKLAVKVKEICQEQAWLAFREIATQQEEEIKSYIKEELTKSMGGITAIEGIASAQEAYNQVCSKIITAITTCKSWKEEPALLETDTSQIDLKIKELETQLTDIAFMQPVIDYAKDNIDRLHKINSLKDGKDIYIWCQEMIRDNNSFLIEYAIKYKNMSINLKNQFLNTPLHEAAKFNKKEIVEVLLKYGAISSENRLGKLPIDLTREASIKDLLNKK